MSRSKLSDFDIISRLGAGSFGTVYKVRRLLDEQFYVIKNVRIAELSYKEQTEAINEVQILAQLKSPFVVRYYDSFIEKDSLHIVMEFCNRGDLQNLLRKAKDKNVPGLKDNVVWNISLQVMLGLHYLHRKHILHRDLKTANVFLLKDPSQENYLVKIGDLGVAKLMDTSTALANTIVGTPYYLSPELCKDLPYRDKSDCWALGVVLYECLTLQRPFDARNQCALILKIIEAEPLPPPNPSIISSTLWSLALWLLQKDPNKRPTVRELLGETLVRNRCIDMKLPLPEEVLNTEPTSYLREDPPPISSRQKHSFEHDDPPSNIYGNSNQLKTNRDAQEKQLVAADLSSNDNPPHPDNNASGSHSNPNPSQPGSAKITTSTKISNPPPQRTPSYREGNQKIRGDRVRGNNRRTPSEKALNRYQVKPPTKTGSIDYQADKKSTGHQSSSSFKDFPQQEKGNSHDLDDYPPSVDHPTSYDDHGNHEVDEEQEEDPNNRYPSDFEADEDINEEEAYDDAKGTYSRQRREDKGATDLFSPVETVAQTFEDHHLNNRSNEAIAEEDNDQTIQRGNSVVTTNHGEHDLEAWKDAILEGKRKAFDDLGDDLYQKVYDLCDYHMKQSVQENQDDHPEGAESSNNRLVRELEALLKREQYHNFELACEAAFRIKMLVVLESIYGKIEDLHTPTASTRSHRK